MSSVAVTNGAVWFAPTSALEGRYGIAASGPDLQEWKVWRSDSTYAVPSGVRALLGQADGMWAGGESGLHRLEAEVQRWSEVPGVDAALRPVLTLAPASGADGGGTWVGTARGLLRVVGAAADPDVSLLPAEVVTCVLEAAGAVWIGTPHGLFTSPVDGPSGEVPPAGRTAGPAALRGSVGGIAAVGDTIVVGLDAEVWWLPGAPAEWARVDAVGRQRGPITAVAVHDGTLWVGSRAELTVWDMRGGAVRHLTFGVDIPPDERGATGISAIAPTSRSEAWLATPAGAVRIETGL